MVKKPAWTSKPGKNNVRISDKKAAAISAAFKNNSSKADSAKFTLVQTPSGQWIEVPKNPYANYSSALSTPLQHPLVKQAAAHIMNNLPIPAQMAIQTATAINNSLPPEKRVSMENATKAFKGSGSVPSFSGSSASTMNASYGLSKAPNPKPVQLNSSIMPNAYSNDYMTPMLNACSPMHVNNAVLQIPTVSTDPLYTYFINTIAFDIQTRAQSNVTFNIDITSTLTTANILTAFNAAIKALQVYFYYTSILSYESDARNKNAAMIQLRSLMTPQLISDLAVLGRRLEDTPVPPRLVEYIRYLNMNFLSGDSQGAPIIKIGCFYDCLYGVNATTNASLALSALTGGSNNAVFALIRRAIPKWRIGTLYDVPVIPVYDKNFVTVFANLPSQYIDSGGTNTKRTPTVTLSTDNIAYNSYCNRLDGAAYASTGVYSGTSWYGLLVPSVDSSNPRNRLSYYTNGTTASWYPVEQNSFLTSAREETYQIQSPNTTAPISVHLFGTDKLQGVSLSAIQQTQQNLLDFLFDVNNIPTKGKMSSFNRSGSNKI